MRLLFAAVRLLFAEHTRIDETSEHRTRPVAFSAESPLDHTLFATEVPVDVQLVAVDEIAKGTSMEAAEFLLNQWRRATPIVREKILDELLSDDDWTRGLLDAIDSNRIPASEMDAVRRQKLLSHRRDDIREKAESVLKLSISADRQRVINSYADVLTMTGDVKAGRAVFEKRCAACHKLQDVGKNVGPNLAALTDPSDQAMLTAILDPNRAVEARYIAYTAVGKSGKTHSGLITSESGNSITLSSTDGKDLTLLRSDLDELVSSRKSFMPEGLEKDLSHKDLADVIAFVRHAGGADRPKVFQGNTPELVQANIEGILRLTARNCELHGPSIAFENYHGNLGQWASQADHAKWTVNVPHAGRYRVRLHYACDPKTAGHEFEFQLGKSIVRHRVAATKDRDTYRMVDVGTMELTARTQRAELRPTESLQSWLMDLKELQLTPVE